MNKTLLWISICFSLGIGIGGLSSAMLPMLLFLPVLISLVVIINISVTHSYKILIFAVAFLLGAVFFNVRLHYHENAAKPFYGKTAFVCARVTGTGKTDSGYNKLTVKTETITLNGARHFKKLNVIIYAKDAPSVKAGQKILAVADIVSNSQNTAGSDFRFYLMGQNVHITAFADNITVLDETISISPVAALLQNIRYSLSNAFENYLSHDAKGLINGVLSGNTDGLSAETEDSFRICGLSHIVAVSGFNLSIIALAVTFLFSAVKLGGAPPRLLSIALIWFFTVFVGAPLSVLRAAIMLTVFILSDIFKRQGDAFSSLGFSALVILLINPASFYDIGFRLSFAATLSILLFCQPLYALLARHIPGKIADISAVTLSAQIGVYPLLALHFNTLPCLGLIANLFVVPAVPVLMAGGFILWLISPFAKAASVLGAVLSAFCKAVFYVVDIISHLPLASIVCRAPSFTEILIYILVMYAFYAYLKSDRVYIYPALCSAAFLSAAYLALSFGR